MGNGDQRSLCFIIKLLDSWPEGVWWDIHSVSRNCRDHGGDEGWQKLRYGGGDTEAPEAEGKAELSPRVKRNRATEDELHTILHHTIHLMTYWHH